METMAGNISVTSYVFAPGDLVRVTASVLQEFTGAPIGIIIRNSSFRLAYEEGYCDEWVVLVAGKIRVLPAQQIWPYKNDDDYVKYVYPEYISYK